MNARTQELPNPWHDLTARLVFHARTLNHAACYLVTSCGPREGKTTVCRNVAAVAAATGLKTGVLEIHSPEREGGLSLSKRESPAPFQQVAGLGYAVWTLADHFGALPRHSQEPRLWLTDVDLFLIDAPPVGRFMQQHLAPLTDGVILVVDSRRRRLVEVNRAAKLAVGAGGTLLGAILNRHRSPLPRWLDWWGDVSLSN